MHVGALLLAAIVVCIVGLRWSVRLHARRALRRIALRALENHPSGLVEREIVEALVVFARALGLRLDPDEVMRIGRR